MDEKQISNGTFADRDLERETGIEPATNGLGSRDSTTELLPPVIGITAEIVTLYAIFKNLPSIDLVNTQ